MYQLSVCTAAVGDDRGVDDEAATRFLNSFRFEKPKP